jgi:hypothetical protein
MDTQLSHEDVARYLLRRLSRHYGTAGIEQVDFVTPEPECGCSNFRVAYVYFNDGRYAILNVEGASFSYAEGLEIEQLILRGFVQPVTVH